MTTLPSPLPPFPDVTLATLRAERLTAALGFLNNNLAWLAEQVARMQQPETYVGYHADCIARIATYTKQARHWANLVSELHAEDAR